MAAAIGSISPVAIQQFFDANGDPLAGGTLGFYLAGTNTPTPAYSDNNLTVALENPVILDAAGRAPQLFLDALSYKQVLKNALGTTIWTADNLTTPTALRSAQFPISLTGNQNDVAIPRGIVSFVDFRNTAPLTITGFSGGTPGQILMLRALGTAQVDLVFNSLASAAGNRLFNFATSGPTSIVPQSGAAMYVYVQPWWILVTHEQGPWIRMPYAASHFVAWNSPGDQWVVDAGDIQSLDWKLSGTSLMITISLTFTSVIGTPTALAIINWPYHIHTAAGGIPASAYPGSGNYEAALIGSAQDADFLIIQRENFLAWPATTDGTHLYAQITVDVT